MREERRLDLESTVKVGGKSVQKLAGDIRCVTAQKITDAQMDSNLQIRIMNHILFLLYVMSLYHLCMYFSSDIKACSV